MSALERIALEDTQHWLEAAVIGLNLCPFAKAVVVKQRIRYHVCASDAPQDLLVLLREELLFLTQTDAQEVETTLLIAPRLLPDFLDFNDFLSDCDAVLNELGLAGELQIADFHPRYQFGGTEADDVSNCTNRAPYPTLHLLREASIDQAVASFPDAAQIFERNIEVLETLGAEGWAKLGVQARQSPHG